MQHKTPTALWLALAIGLPATTAQAAQDRDLFTHGPKDTNPNFVEPEAWKETGSVQPPPWPNDADLVEFRVSDRTSPFRHYIDTKSLSVDAQQIVRYTVVVKSSSGGSNVAYEGMRCTPNGSFRTYAYGSGGRFQPTGGADWRDVNANGVPPYVRDLHRFYLCVPLKFEPRPVKEMPRVLSGRGSARDNSGFLPD
jgi:hypothetical protein